MAATWYEHLVRPSALGGAGQALAVLSAPADEIRVLIGPAPASSETDPACFSVDVLESYDTYFYGAPPADDLTASWFARFGVTWETGPVVTGVDLSNRYHHPVPVWPKGWLVAVFQSAAKTMPPWSTKTLRVLGGFPRDPQTWPCLTVQVDEILASNPVVGDSLMGGSVIGTSDTQGRNHEVRASIIGWCQTPEDRDDLAIWLGTAMMIASDQARLYGLQEPTYSMTESEDMEGGGTGIPIFLVSANFSASKWASLQKSVYSAHGLVAYPPVPYEVTATTITIP